MSAGQDCLFEIGVAEGKLSAEYRSVFERYRTAYREHSKQEGRSPILQAIFRFRSSPIRLYEHLLGTLEETQIAALDALCAMQGAGLDDWRLHTQLELFEQQFKNALKALAKALALSVVEPA